MPSVSGAFAANGRDLVRSVAPTGAAFADLKPTNLLGLLYFTLCSVLTGLALLLSSFSSWLLWLSGQILLSVALLQWFVLLHEAGHNTLFRSPRLNRLAGYLAGFFALIPFGCWKLVHGVHHHWTGWQDLDLTTAVLVPRKLSWLEKRIIDFCWLTGIPLFSTLYRVNNFWNLVRLFRIFPRRAQRIRLTVSAVLSLIVYAAVVSLLGWELLLQFCALGLVLTLMLQDPLILSQHTHIPLKLSNGEAVKPFPPMEQEVFTRSLRFPRWFSSLVLLHLDAHELHHMYTRVPGYRLGKIDYRPQNEMHWWRWLVKAKCVPAHVFLFQNRNQTGYDL